MLEGIALVGNPQFAIIDEAYPYLSKRLLTDNSPRMRAALRYMVYGSSETFDVERLIDLLQALEKFVAVRDTGDGTAYKVDGVRGGVYVGQAGDARGTQALRDEDGAAARSALDSYRAEVALASSDDDGFIRAPVDAQGLVGRVVPTTATATTATAATAPTPAAAPAPAPTDAEAAASTAREALRFFFSDDGAVFRGFLLDEVVRAADTLSRAALARLAATPVAGALDALPAPPGLGGLKRLNKQLLESLAPTPTAEEEKVVASIRKLIAFFAGDLDLEAEAAAGEGGGSGGGSGGGDASSGGRPSSLTPDADTLQTARALLPVLQENQAEMQQFALQIVGRLVELQAQRALGLVRARLAEV